MISLNVENEKAKKEMENLVEITNVMSTELKTKIFDYFFFFILNSCIFFLLE